MSDTTETAAAGRGATVIREIMSGGATRAVLSVIAGFVIGAIFMVFSSEEFLVAAQYFTSRPADALGAAWTAIAEGYSALFRGSIYNYKADDVVAAFRPMTETLRFAGP
ncbi:MAG: hypothetical protein RL107_67, partial [Actinomycetota bacterium]